MIALQYAFDLPDDADMMALRRRVAAKGPLFDDHPGLVQKAFLANRRGAAGAPGNEYAPFYVWRSADAVADFLRGDLFQGVVEAFGRPAVRTWTVLAFHRPAPAVVPTFAVRRISPIPEEANLANLVPAAARPPAAVRRTGLHSRLIAADWERWELVRLELWRAAVDAGPEALCGPTYGDRHTYEILRLSAPGSAASDAAA